VISLHMNSQGKQAYLGQALIAQRAGLSERAVGKHVAVAKASGWLAIRKRHRPGQAWYGLEYSASVPEALAIHRKQKPWGNDSATERPAPGAGRNGERPAPDDRRPAHGGSTTGTDKHDDQHHVPTILGFNSGSELRNNTAEAQKALSPEAENLKKVRRKVAFVAGQMRVVPREGA
jgi:hypothetical protein